jgi:hypothetical protein
MNAVVQQAPADSRKAKLVMLFCALGLAMCLLDLGAGVWLWKYAGGYQGNLPTYDRFLADVRAASCGDLAEIALSTHAGWEACEQMRAGVQETVVHIVLAASFVGVALFSLCFLLAFVLHRELVAAQGGEPEPIAPDDVDGTWR